MTENEPARPAAGTPGTSRTGNAVTRRGDLVVICLRHRDWKDGQPREYHDFWLGQVTSVTAPGWSACTGPPAPSAGTPTCAAGPARGSRCRPCGSSGPRSRARRRSTSTVPSPRGLPHLARPRGPRPRLRHPQGSQGGAAPAPAGPARLGTAPRRSRCLGGRLAGGQPAAERGGPRPRHGVPPPVGSLRRRRGRREQRLPRAARAGGPDRKPAPGAPEPVTETWTPRRHPRYKDGKEVARVRRVPGRPGGPRRLVDRAHPCPDPDRVPARRAGRRPAAAPWTRRSPRSWNWPPRCAPVPTATPSPPTSSASFPAVVPIRRLVTWGGTWRTCS